MTKRSSVNPNSSEVSSSDEASGAKEVDLLNDLKQELKEEIRTQDWP